MRAIPPLNDWLALNNKFSRRAIGITLNNHEALFGYTNSMSNGDNVWGQFFSLQQFSRFLGPLSIIPP